MTENERNNLQETITHILEDMKKEEGAAFSLEKVNLAEMERRTGISRKKLRLIKTNGFKVLPNGNLGKSKKTTVLSGFTGVIDSYLKKRVRNSKTITDKIKDIGYTGSRSQVKRYIKDHLFLMPARRSLVAQHNKVDSTLSGTVKGTSSRCLRTLDSPFKRAGGQLRDARHPLAPQVPKSNLHTNLDLTALSCDFFIFQQISHWRSSAQMQCPEGKGRSRYPDFQIQALQRFCRPQHVHAAENRLISGGILEEHLLSFYERYPDKLAEVHDASIESGRKHIGTADRRKSDQCICR